MHTPFEMVVGCQPDFRVKYRFYKKEEEGRSFPPYQGYRSDFWYYHEDHKSAEIFMIWPEFENEKGEVILDTDSSVSESGQARMWIIIPERRIYHKGKITIGLNGYFMEGLKK